MRVRLNTPVSNTIISSPSHSAHNKEQTFYHIQIPPDILVWSVFPRKCLVSFLPAQHCPQSRASNQILVSTWNVSSPDVPTAAPPSPVPVCRMTAHAPSHFPKHKAKVDMKLQSIEWPAELWLLLIVTGLIRLPNIELLALVNKESIAGLFFSPSVISPARPLYIFRLKYSKVLNKMFVEMVVSEVEPGHQHHGDGGVRGEVRTPTPWQLVSLILAWISFTNLSSPIWQTDKKPV